MSLLFLLTFFVSSGLAADADAPPRLGDGLEVGTPDARSFNQSLLHSGIARAEKLPYSQSLLVMKDGKLVVEKYFHGTTVDSAEDVKSVTKSFVSALLGVALHKKLVESVETPVKKYFPDVFARMNDPRKNQLRIKHLLSMTAGLDADDFKSGVVFEGPEKDIVEAALERPLITEPGKAFSYCTPYADIIAWIIVKASGLSLRRFAEENLLNPLKIKVKSWHADKHGFFDQHPAFSSRDLAKFGLLFLNKGKFQGKQLIPASWVAESTSAKSNGRRDNGKYGYFWWSDPDAETPYYFAWGWGGQFIYVVPSKKMVVVMTNSFWERRKPVEIRNIAEKFVIAAAKN